MGIEISQDYGGAGSTFFSTTLVIEALAAVDMGTTVMVDIQNTLVNILIERYGTQEQKQQYLPKLATDTVSRRLIVVMVVVVVVVVVVVIFVVVVVVVGGRRSHGSKPVCKR